MTNKKNNWEEELSKIIKRHTKDGYFDLVDGYLPLEEFITRTRKDAIKEDRAILLEEIKEDLEKGKFYQICSNETTFKDYIKQLLK